MKEKQKLPTKFYTLVSALLGEENHFCVSLYCTWGLGNRVSVQKTLVRQVGLGFGPQASWSCAQASKAESRETSAHVAAHVATMEVKSWSKNSSRLGAVPETRFPSDSLLNKLIKPHLRQYCPLELSVMMAMSYICHIQDGSRSHLWLSST